MRAGGPSALTWSSVNGGASEGCASLNSITVGTAAGLVLAFYRGVGATGVVAVLVVDQLPDADTGDDHRGRRGEQGDHPSAPSGREVDHRGRHLAGPEHVLPGHALEHPVQAGCDLRGHRLLDARVGEQAGHAGLLLGRQVALVGHRYFPAVGVRSGRDRSALDGWRSGGLRG